MVDSSVWIDHLNNQPTPQVQRLRGQLLTGDVALCDFVLMEVLQGIRDDRRHDRTLAALQTYPIHSLGGAPLAIRAANNYRSLRARGITIRSSIDCLIATFCIENGFELLHSDRDYRPFELHLGLRVVA